MREFMAWLGIAAGVTACAGTGHDSILRDSLESGKPPLASHLEGPVSVYDVKTGETSTACGDDALAKVGEWEHELRDDGGPVCTLDSGTPAFIVCVAISSVDQRSLALIFDDVTTRLVGVARAPLAMASAYGPWLATLPRGTSPKCAAE